MSDTDKSLQEEEERLLHRREEEQLLQQDDTSKQVLRRLLDTQKEKSDHVLAVQSEMGGTRSFVTSISLEWIAPRVKFARDLPSLRAKYDKKTGKTKIDKESLDLIQQREPDWRRQYTMTRYLAEHESHKFPPILVVAWKPWVNEPESDKWNSGKASENSVTESPLDSYGAYLDLNCADTGFYALDGQHRLMAILGLQELLTKGKLYALNEKQEQRKSKFITLDDVAGIIGESDEESARARLQGLMNESIGIEIIPAVQKGESADEARIRLRNIFVHVNKHAKGLTRGQNALLDEDYGYAIVARKLMVEHRLFAGGRVDPKNSQLAESSRCYTTLDALVLIARAWLKPVFPEWEPADKDDVPIRPSKKEIEKGIQLLSKYFDFLSTLPSHVEMIQDQQLSCEKFRKEDESENILFRPIAQIALAEAMATLGDLKPNLEPNWEETEARFKVLASKEKGESQFRLRIKTSIWFGVLCDVNQRKMRNRIKYRNLCVKLLVHLLGGGTKAEARKKMEKEFQDARIIDQQYSINLDGKTVAVSEVTVPSPWWPE